MLQPRWFARMAFIGNFFFLACIVLQYRAATQESHLISLVAILGLVLGMGCFNPVSNMINLVLLLRKRLHAARVPGWLAVVNCLFLVLQIFYLLHTWS